MLPRDLKAEDFSAYPPAARRVLASHLSALQPLPLIFLPSLLREVIDYDYKFPAERAFIDGELTNLGRLTPGQVQDWFQAFSRCTLSPTLEQMDWVQKPAQFTEQLAAYLWSTHQMDAFREAATAYGNRLLTAVPVSPPPVKRLGIAVIGQGVTSYDAPLFRNLRAHGTYFGKVKPDQGLELLLSGMRARAQAHPAPYGHWYVDGGQATAESFPLTCISYQSIKPVRDALLRKMQAEINRPGMGPEELRTYLAQLAPSDLGMDKAGDAALDHFQIRLLTEGSGTQIYSTTFAQWTAREALRRAQPLSLLVRFAPRQRQRPMNELLAGAAETADLDPTGSLIDADMSAYYQWINQQRLPGAESSSFLVWFEGQSQAVAISPSLPRGTESSSSLDLGQLFTMITT